MLSSLGLVSFPGNETTLGLLFLPFCFLISCYVFYSCSYINHLVSILRRINRTVIHYSLLQAKKSSPIYTEITCSDVCSVTAMREVAYQQQAEDFLSL